MKISLNNNNWTVRQAAFRKLNDNSLQNMISEGKDPAVILAARIRLGYDVVEACHIGECPKTEME